MDALEAVTLNVAFEPSQTVAFCGWLLITANGFTVSNAPADVAGGVQLPVTTTL